MTALSTPLKGKVTLITGSSRGMGRQHALELATRGADVVLNYISSAAPAEDTVKKIEALGVRAVDIQADISDVGQIEALFKQAVEKMGKLDIVVSNSGVEYFGPIEGVSTVDFDKTFNINTRGQFSVAQQAHKYLAVGGKFVLLSSISAQAHTVKDHAIYAGGKAAVEAFTRCFAIDFADKKISVNCIGPGGVKTDMYYENVRNYLPNNGKDLSNDQVDEMVIKNVPLGKICLPENISNVVAFLVSDQREWVNGKVITISGGAAS